MAPQSNSWTAYQNHYSNDVNVAMSLNWSQPLNSGFLLTISKPQNNKQLALLLGNSWTFILLHFMPDFLTHQEMNRSTMKSLACPQTNKLNDMMQWTKSSVNFLKRNVFVLLIALLPHLKGKRLCLHNGD